TGAAGPGIIEANVAIGNVSGAIDLSAHTAIGQVFTITATGNLTFNATNAPQTTPSSSGYYYLRITQGGAGSYTISLTNYKFMFPPILSTGVGVVSLLAFFFDGTNHIFIGMQNDIG